MPYVNVKITRDGVTPVQKKKLVQDITRTLVDTLGKKPEHIHIVIDEVDAENWGFAGMLTTEYRASLSSRRRGSGGAKRSKKTSDKVELAPAGQEVGLTPFPAPRIDHGAVGLPPPT